MNISVVNEWVEAYTDDLYNWAYHKTSSVETAEDLVQETFVAAVTRLVDFQQKSNPKTWLFAILNNKIVDYYRSKTKNRFLTSTDDTDRFFGKNGRWSDESSPKQWHTEENLLDDEDFRQQLKDCLDDLPGNWQLAVKLKYLMQKSGDEICQELQINTTNYWQIIHRAKLKLRKCLEVNWFNN